MYSNEWFYEMERRFALEQFDDDSGFRIEQGVIPVIVSASHAVSQWREDKIKRGEFRTGPISLWLHQTTNCHAIYKTKNKMDDANFDKRSTYRDALIQHIQANSVQYLLDLHMMHPSRHSGIDIGTANGRNTHSDPQALSQTISIFSQFGLSPTVNRYFKASRPSVVTRHAVQETNLWGVQLEMNWLLVQQHIEVVLLALQRIVQTLSK